MQQVDTLCDLVVVLCRIIAGRRIAVAREGRSLLVVVTGPGRNAGNLPAGFTSFVGRRQDIIAVERLLTRARLVTLTGVGGVGKSRPKATSNTS